MRLRPKILAPSLKLHRLAAANDRLRVDKPRVATRLPGNPGMNTPPDLAMPTAVAATYSTEAGATPRIRLLGHGFSIDHPDQALGEQLMANALGSPIATRWTASSGNW